MKEIKRLFSITVKEIDIWEKHYNVLREENIFGIE